MTTAAMAPVKFWRYYLPCDHNREGWAEIVICSTGFFAAVSDYGDYAYAWRATGCEDVREFFLRAPAEWHYFAGKLGGPRARIYDGEGTANAIREYILGERRRCGMTRTEARHEWDLIEECGVEDSEIGFNRFGEATDIEEWWDFHCRCFDPNLLAFCRKTMARLAEAIRTELLNEAIPMKTMGPL